MADGILGAVPLYRHYTSWESTDDAQIDGYIYPVSSRVSGYVTRVMADDNQYIEAGTVLVRLDPKDYEVAAANANATLANDQASAAAVCDAGRSRLALAAHGHHPRGGRRPQHG